VVDSGTTRSVIKAPELQTPPKTSGNYVYSVGVCGKPQKQHLTLCLVLILKINLSKLCPVNLLGRD